MYVDFEYYSQTYKGKITEDNFTPLTYKAQALVDYYTFNRIKTVTQNVRFAICELIDVINDNEINDTKGVQSEKVGSYAITYEKGSSQTSAYNNSVKMIIYKWLPSDLLYRGTVVSVPDDFEVGG